MSGISATRTRTETFFRNYSVRRKGSRYWAVTDSCGTELTSGTSRWNAEKKARLLEVGYEQCRELYEDLLR